MQGDRLVIAPTALKTINVALAPSEEGVEQPPVQDTKTNHQAQAKVEQDAEVQSSTSVNSDASKKPSQQGAENVAANKGSKSDEQKLDVKPESNGIALPEVWIPLTIEAQRLDIHDFKLAGDTPVIVHHLGLEAKAGW